MYVLLDTGVIGILSSSPNLTTVAACELWLDGMNKTGVVVIIPDITVYEIRRELLRLDAKVKLSRLDRLLDRLGTCPVLPEAWSRAAEFWAETRRMGLPTADPHALDGDAILAGVADTMGRPGDSVIIATTNVGHLSRFPGIEARTWEQIP